MKKIMSMFVIFFLVLLIGCTGDKKDLIHTKLIESGYITADQYYSNIVVDSERIKEMNCSSVRYLNNERTAYSYDYTAENDDYELYGLHFYLKSELYEIRLSSNITYAVFPKSEGSLQIGDELYSRSADSYSVDKGKIHRVYYRNKFYNNKTYFKYVYGDEFDYAIIEKDGYDNFDLSASFSKTYEIYFLLNKGQSVHIDFIPKVRMYDELDLCSNWVTDYIVYEVESDTVINLNYLDYGDEIREVRIYDYSNAHLYSDLVDFEKSEKSYVIKGRKPTFCVKAGTWLICCERKKLHTKLTDFIDEVENFKYIDNFDGGLLEVGNIPVLLDLSNQIEGYIVKVYNQVYKVSDDYFIDLNFNCVLLQIYDGKLLLQPYTNYSFVKIGSLNFW